MRTHTRNQTTTRPRENDVDSGNGRPSQLMRITDAQGPDNSSPELETVPQGGVDRNDDDQERSTEGGSSGEEDEEDTGTEEEVMDDIVEMDTSQSYVVPNSDSGPTTEPAEFTPQAPRPTMEGLMQMMLTQSAQLQRQIVAQDKKYLEAQKRQEKAQKRQEKEMQRQDKRFADLQKEIQAGRVTASIKKGAPPTFSAKEGEDIDNWILDTTEYYSDKTTIMLADDAKFVDIIVRSSALKGVAMSWYHTFKDKATNHRIPRTWQYFQKEITERFRDADHQYKLITKMVQDRPNTNTGGMTGYVSRYLANRSQRQSDQDIIDRWIFQQHLDPELITYINQLLKEEEDIHEVIKLAQKFTDARNKSMRGNGPERKQYKDNTDKKHPGGHGGAPKGKIHRPVRNNEKKFHLMTADEKEKHLKTIKCRACDKMGHYANMDICPKKK